MTGFFAVAITTVKASGGILGSADIDLLYSAGLVSLLILGPGALAVDNLIANSRSAESSTSSEAETDVQPKEPTVLSPGASIA